MLQGSFEDAEHLAIHVILGYAEEQERADYPAEAPGEYARRVEPASRARTFAGARLANRFSDHIVAGTRFRCFGRIVHRRLVWRVGNSLNMSLDLRG